MGSGGFGRVHMVESDGSGRHVAKFIPKDPGAGRELLFRRLSSDVRNIVPVVDTGEWDAYWVIVMPKAEMSLADLLSNAGGPVPEVRATPILIDVAGALVSTKNRVVHRDIKPANILLLDGRWCLADFGISRYAEATTADNTRRFAWTPQYAAPEQWRGERATSSTDVYAFGGVAYHLLAGHPPFGGPEYHDYRKQHLHDAPAQIPDIAAGMVSLVDECLMKPPEARPSPESILFRLDQAHPPRTEAARRLQEANSRVLRERVERASVESAAQSERERKRQLREAAEKSLGRIVAKLFEEIHLLAPASDAGGQGRSGWDARLGPATLRVSPVSQASTTFAVSGSVEWEVLAYSSITLRMPRDRSGHEGMAHSHSLWYLRRGGDDNYRWYELAFRIHPLSRRRSTVNPFSLPPQDNEAQFALTPGTHAIDVAQRPVPIDQGAEERFVEQWIGRLADSVTEA